MKVGLIGLGNVGGSIARNLIDRGVDLAVNDLDDGKMQELAAAGARPAARRALLETQDVVITCLPSPAASAEVIERLAPFWPAGRVWMEMSTTDAEDLKRLARMVEARGGLVAECPVSGGVHRARTGNIAVFVGGERAVFDRVLPLLTLIGGDILFCGPLGTASALKVMTNYLATANLLSLCEALAVTKAQGIDLGTAYEAIRISSGNSFVHETESQVILSGSRDIHFTMDLVLKDVGLFAAAAEAAGVALEIAPLVIDIFRDGQRRYGSRAQSDLIIGRLEERAGLSVTAPGFPRDIVDEKPPGIGREVKPRR